MKTSSIFDFICVCSFNSFHVPSYIMITMEFIDYLLVSGPGILFHYIKSEQQLSHG